jgi:hypothetical protein
MNRALQKDLERATKEAAQCARTFANFVADEKPEPASLAEAAKELYEKVGRLAALAGIAAGRTV